MTGVIVRRRLARIVVALAVCGYPGPARAQYPAPGLERPLAEAVAGDLAEGKRLYNAQCALCHGIDGGGGYGPSLLSPTFARAADDAGLFTLVRTGIPGVMPGFGDANGPKRSWQLAAFVRSMTRASGAPPVGDVAHGRAVYQARGCANCHVLGGEGRAFGPDLTSIGLQRGPAYLRQALVEPAARVPDGHVVVTVRAKTGPAIRGVRVSEDAFWVHVRDAGGRLHTMRVSDLAEFRREAGASLMPAYGALVAADLDDLVAYLSTLRGRR
jgi:cytochrome c oxidase cbb3-type subunit III